MKSVRVLAVTCALAGVSSAFAGTIDFENTPNTFWEPNTHLNGQDGAGNDLGGYFSGVTFGAGVQATSTSTVFPAHSGQLELVTSDLFNPVLSFAFNSAQPDVSFWYTTSFGFIAEAFDQNHVSLGTKIGVINVVIDPNNGAGTGSDTFLDFGFGNISSVEITDNSGLGNFLTIDDLSAVGVNGLPAPDATSTLGLLGVAGVGLAALRRKLAR